MPMGLWGLGRRHRAEAARGGQWVGVGGVCEGRGWRWDGNPLATLHVYDEGTLTPGATQVVIQAGNQGG
jgi:hypothetical protein